MNDLTVSDRVKKIIREHLGVDEDRIVPEAHILDDLGADSLDTVEIVLALECEFEIEISDDDMERIGTVGDCVSLIEKGLANA